MSIPKGFGSTRAITASVALAGLITVTACRKASVDPAHSSAETPTAARSNEEAFAAALNQLVSSGGDLIRLDHFFATDDHVEVLANVERLRVIRIDGGKLTPAAGRRLAEMPHLEQLHLRNVEFDDAFVQEVSQSRTLWLLNLAAANVSPAAVAQLAQMPQLRQLRLAIPGGDNSYAAAVASIQTLQSVHLIGIAITDEGLQELAQLPALQSLYLDDTDITDEGWVWLFEHRPGLHVHIDQKHHDRDPQRH